MQHRFPGCSAIAVAAVTAVLLLAVGPVAVAVSNAAASDVAGDPAKGAAIARRCMACHSLEKDGPNRLGPHLWGVVGRPIASVPDFRYSDAMKAHAEEAGTWTDDNLRTYLKAPMQVVRGTRMAFAGVKHDKDLADLIAYLDTLSD